MLFLPLLQLLPTHLGKCCIFVQIGAVVKQLGECGKSIDLEMWLLWGLLYTVHSTQYTVHSTLYTVHCTQYTVQCSVSCGDCCTQYTVHCTLYSAVCPVGIAVHSTQYTVQCSVSCGDCCTQYTVHCTVQCVLWGLLAGSTKIQTTCPHSLAGNSLNISILSWQSET